MFKNIWEFLLIFVCSNWNIRVWTDSTANWTVLNEICGISYSDRIVGGSRASLGQFPWIAHLGIMRRNNYDTFTLSYECGGALIHPTYVITAAHCTVDFEEGEYLAAIKLGEHNLETEIDCENNECADPLQIIQTKKIIIPREYDGTILKHDLAIIELSEPANITQYVSPICLPTEVLRRNSLVREIVEVAGWGWFDIDDPRSSPILQFIMLPVVDIERCREIKQLKHYNFSMGQICVGGQAGKDSCNGDSGGPLVKIFSSKEYGPRYYLFGIVSVGVPSCGKFPLPAVYTNVSHYLPWIYNNVKI
ncbi:CLUMA_CG021014, isoform A [Clunio marinus]|uniref:CLUMA_CG021014, isoform A n=1 Tax=Clunio marinus TaxID=568069 RepID=A0A1J1J8Q2_9DIPT|nr:CLUMA_CG021014, isoform A [Clunio marinus]